MHHEASVSISMASTEVHPCFIPFHQHAREKKLACTACAFAGYCVRHLPLYSILPKARGLRYQSSSWCTRFRTCRLLCPIRLSVRALAFRWGLPYLLPTRLNIPHEVSRVRHGSLKRNEVGGVLLAAPIRSLRFPSRPTG